MSLNICITWEQSEYGGVDTYLSHIINNWEEKEDNFTIIYNEENKGVERLRNELINYKNITYIKFQSVFKYYDGKSFKSKFLRYTNFLLLPMLFLLSILKYKKIMRQKNFDILLAQNGGYPASYGVLSSIFAASFLRIKVKLLVVHHAAVKSEIFTGWFRLIIERFFSNNLNRIICVSKETKKTIDYFTRITDDQKCSSIVINNGILLDKKIQAFKEYNYPINILVLGRMDPYKGHDDLINAISLMERKYQEMISINFIGKYDEEYKNKIQDLYNALNIKSPLKICGYDKRQLNEIFDNVDLLIMPTRTFEGFGLTIVEALKFSIPVISSRLGIAEELFENEPDYLYEPGNFYDLSEKIRNILSDKKNLIIPQNVISNINNFDIKKVNQQYRSLMISEMIKNK